MKILIIKTSSLGDVIHALPVIDFLSSAVPAAEIDWVVEEQFLTLLEHNPKLNKIFVLKTKKWRKKPFQNGKLKEISELLHAIRKTKYDIVFDLQGNLKSSIVTVLVRCAIKVGFPVAHLQEKISGLFTNRKVSFRESDNTAVNRYLRLVSEPLGLEYSAGEHKGTIYSSTEENAKAEQYLAKLPSGLKIILQVGTTWETKLWHRDGWIELAKGIHAAFPGAMLLINWGSAAEKQLAEEICTETGSYVTMLPWFTVKELIPVIARSDLAIGGDTGPLYMAAAMGTPTLSFYRATDASIYAPQGEQNISIQADMPCRGCGKTLCSTDAECRESISVADMLTAAIKILSEVNSK